MRTVTATNGQTAVAVQEITAGNTRPTVTLSVPDGAFFDFGDRIPYTVTVTDPEESSIDCSRVVVQTQLGHDSHAHPLDNMNWERQPGDPGLAVAFVLQ